MQLSMKPKKIFLEYSIPFIINFAQNSEDLEKKIGASEFKYLRDYWNMWLLK